MICQATVSDGRWSALDVGAPWCDKEAVTTVRLSLVRPSAHHEGRTANVWVCQEHYDEYVRAMDL